MERQWKRFICTVMSVLMAATCIQSVKAEEEVTAGEETEEVIDETTEETVEEETIEPVYEDEASDFTYSVNADTVTITGYTGSDTEIVIPAEIDGKTVTAIGNDAFSGNKTLTSITISEGITTIGIKGFYSCTVLSNIVFPSSLITIEREAFRNCTALESAVFPEGLQKIDNLSFFNCPALKNADFSDTITTIGDSAFTGAPIENLVLPAAVVSVGTQAFANNPYLTSITIPKTLTAGVGSGTNAASPFTGCENLQEVLFEEGITSIPHNLFNKCFFESIIIPEGVQTIEWGAFYACASLKNIVFPSTLVTIEREAFRNCTALESAVFPEGMQKIDYLSFMNCTALKNVDFSDTITTIGDNAFNGAPIENLVLPAAVVSVGTQAFANNPNLSSVTIPKTLTAGVGSGTNAASPFAGCANLKEILFEEGITSIPHNLFNKCSFESVIIPEGVQTIEWGAFYACASLKNIVFPSTLVTIEREAFRNCTALESAVFPEGMQKIENLSFMNCTALKNVDFSDTITTIGDNAFDGAPIENLVLPAAVVSVGIQAFANNPNLSSITIPKTLTAGVGSGTNAASPFAGCENLKEVLFEEGITFIPHNLFNKCSFESVIIPEGVQTIEWGAFYACASLKNIVFPSSLVTIEPEAFRNCTVLESAVFPEGMQKIDYLSFMNCTALKNVDFSDTITAIGYNAFDGAPIENLVLPAAVVSVGSQAFANNPNLSSITIPKTLTAGVGSGTNAASPFAGCANLKEILFEEGITSIPHNLFNRCTFESIIIPEGIETIEWGAFYSCTSLKDVAFPTSLVTIEGEAFRKCTALESVVFPEGLQKIDYLSFMNCPALKNVDFSDTITTIGDNAFDGAAIENLVLPAAVVSVGSQAFANNPNLTSITIPKTLTAGVGSGTNAASPFAGCANLKEILFEEGITSIPHNLFNRCTFESIIIPEGIETIEWGAFYSCTSLKDIVFPTSLVTIEGEAFRKCTALESVVFPEGLQKIEYLCFTDCTALQSVSLPNSLTHIDTSYNVFPAGTVLYTNYDAYGITYAVSQGFAYHNRNSEESPSVMIDRSESFYYTDSSTGIINDALNAIIDIKVKDSVLADLSKQSVSFYVPEDITLLYDTVTFNNEPVTAKLDPKTCLASVNLPSKEGKLRFSLRLNGAEKFVSYAIYKGTVGSTSGSDVIGLVDGELAAISMNLPTDTADKQFDVKGRAPADSEVEIYVDSELKDTVKVLKNGSWNASIHLENPVDSYPYTVEAKVKGMNEDKYKAASDIYYNQAAPTITAFDVVYTEHYQKKSVDLMTAKTARIYKDANPYHFEVALANDAKVGKVYVTSTKGSEVRKMEAVYDPVKKKYVAEGYFGDNKNYTAGNISVTYVEKTLTKEEQEERDKKIGEEMDDFWNTSFFELGGADVTWDVNREDKVIGTVDMGKALNDFQNTTAKVIYEHFHSNDAASVFDFIEIGQHTTDALNTFVYKGEDYIFNLDWNSASSFVVVTGKLIDPVNNLVKDLDSIGITFEGSTTTLDKEIFGKFGKIAHFDTDTFKTYAKYEDYIFKLAKIYQKDEELRSQLMWGPYKDPEQQKVKMKKLDALTSDKIAFLTLSTIGKEVLKTSIAGGAGGPAVVMTILVAALVAASIFAFEAREDELKLADGDLKVIMDPSGYVYDSRTEERIEDATASAYCIEYDPSSDMTEDEFFAVKPADDEYGILWNAEEYEQLNPQQTDAEGRYHWDVPTGWWRVKYEKEDYETTWSEWLPVPPPQMEVNIPMKSTKAPEPGMERLAGESRYDTSIRIADELKEQMGVEKFDNIIVASGAGYADALAGGYLAYKKNAPILITSDKRADMIREYIRNNIADNGTVYVLGGPSAVSSSFEEGLEGIHTERLAGAGRYDTNIEILKAAEVSDEEIVIARGTGKSAYADSLSASGSKRPILLVNGDKGLNEKQEEYLEGLKTKQYYIAGGTGAVSETVTKQIEGYGTVERLAGGGRYETSVEIARKFNPDAESVVLAYGANYPDGLCGGPLAAYMNAPLILTKSDKNLEYAQNFCKDLDIHTGYVLGGEGTKEKPLITDDAAEQILQLN